MTTSPGIIPWKFLYTEGNASTVTVNNKPTYAQATSRTCDVTLSQLSAPCMKGDKLVITIPEEEYKLGLEGFKYNLHGRLVLPKGATPPKFHELKALLENLLGTVGVNYEDSLGDSEGGGQFGGTSRFNSMSQPVYSMGIVLCLLLFCVHAAVIFAAITDGRRPQSQDWLNHGGDLFNRRYAYKEYKISPQTAPNLRLKWKFYAGKDISATPAIYDGTLYFPSWNGNIYAVKETDGSLVWKQNLENLIDLNTNASGVLLNVNWTVSRSTPTIVGDLVIVGICGPAVVIGLKRTSGELVWNTTMDHHPAAVITMSGTYYNGSYYVGTSSLEEGASIEECCIFRGSFAKLNAQSGAMVWKTYMLPDNNNTRGGYAGASIWGSSPSIDVNRNHVYIATGNLYSAPQRILECQESQNNQTKPSQPDECVEPENHSNSILALDLDSGNVAWYRQLGGYDVWFIACKNASSPNCPPSGPTPDADFGEAPMMLTSYVNGTKKDMVVAVQKSGFAWALDRNNGNLVWFTPFEVGCFVIYRNESPRCTYDLREEFFTPNFERHFVTLYLSKTESSEQ
ncbi:hypothetical protein Fmac_017593 [Flemingia macrophylla]|uniref:Pyrrolo-quinoline quinone repeat domain-containing protein n=1 Tax=Flemingia macrophylla TaxID=520843 RepID=A0ABD1M2J8_9FABA